MRLFPATAEEFYSPFEPTELLQRVQAAIIRPEKWTWSKLFNTEPSEALFHGSVESNGFNIQRIINYRNDILPQIIGLVQPAPDKPGSILRLQHRLHPFVLVFAFIWLAMVGMGILEMLGTSISTGIFGTDDLIPFGMFAFGLAFFTVPFWLEVRKSRPLLVRLLKLEEVAGA